MATGMMIAGGLAIAGGISSYVSGREASDDAEALGKANAKLIMAETEQEIKNIERTGKQQQGNIKAQGAAGGVKQEGTVQSFMDESRALNKEAADWAMKSGRSRAKIAKMGGEAAGNQASAAGQQALIGGISSGATGGYRAGAHQGWWS